MLRNIGVGLIFSSFLYKIPSCRSVSTMLAVIVDKPGASSSMKISEVPSPVVKDNQVLIKTSYTAINRGDILQRMGRYPPPSGESQIMGLEVSGTIVKVGAAVDSSKISIGDRVMALLGGGGYAQYVNVSSSQIIHMPDDVSFRDAAAIPEAWLTAYQLLFKVAQLSPGKNVLIHAGASGVGTAAIQLVKQFGGVSYATAGSDEKCQFVLKLGANFCINYKQDDFSKKIKELTDNRGIDIILDCVGGSYAQQNVEVLAIDGQWALYGLLGGPKLESPDFLGKLLFKRGHLLSSLLRSRSCNYKAELVSDFSKNVLPHFASGQLQPVVYSEFDFHDISKAHELMESNKNTGKIVVKIDGSQKDEL